MFFRPQKVSQARLEKKRFARKALDYFLKSSPKYKKGSAATQSRGRKDGKERKSEEARTGGRDREKRERERREGGREES